MKKVLLSVVLLFGGALLAFAAGNSEKLSTIEGTVELVPGEMGGEALMLRTEAGNTVRIELKAEERIQLRLETGEKLRVKGVYIGTTVQARTQERILARVLYTKDGEVTVKEPVQLTEQDRLRIEECEKEQDQLRTRDRTQDKTGSGTGSGSGSGTSSSGSGAGKGK